MPTKKKNANRQGRQRKAVRLTVNRAPRRPRRRVMRMARPTLGVANTDAGKRYLECALAPRDFNGVMAQIPDAFCGKSAVFRQKLLLPIAAPSGTTATWNASIIVPPIPNVGCLMIANKDTATPPNTATATWGAFDYANADTVFPGPGTTPDFGTSMVQKYRYVSLTAELKQIGPALSSGGSISAARLPGMGIANHISATATQDYITGFDDVDQTHLQPLPGFYVGHVNAGVYGWSIHEDPTVPFNELWINTAYADVGYTDSGVITKGVSTSSGYLMGFGTQQALAIAITSATKDTSFVLEVEAVIEYQPRGKSLMASMMSDSPPEDKLALQSYQTGVRQMPAFVPVSQNAGFWDKFLTILASAAPIVGRFFGPVGAAIGGGLGTAFSALRLGISGGGQSKRMAEPELD